MAAPSVPPDHPALRLPAAQLAGRIQDTLIGQGVTAQAVEAAVSSALELGFHALIVPGSWVWLARRMLAGTSRGSARSGSSGSGPAMANGPASSNGAASSNGTAGSNRTAGSNGIAGSNGMAGTALRLGSIVDFPYGSATTAARVADAAALVEAGVDELDSTVNIGYLLSGRHSEFADDLAAVVRAAAPVGVKFMLELPLLDARLREVAVAAAVDSGAAYVKNASSGAVGIADPASIAYLRKSVPPSVGVKASGGIKTVQQVRELLAAGADLIGTSSGVSIVTGQRIVAGSLYSY
jgi:deoxyribose-phosphate aldolase